MREYQHHRHARNQHEPRIEWGRGATQLRQHIQAARQNQRHRCPYPREKLAEYAGPQGQSLRRLKHAGGDRAQRHVSEEHAAHPDDDAQQMQKQGQGHGVFLSKQGGVIEHALDRRKAAPVLRAGTVRL